MDLNLIDNFELRQSNVEIFTDEIINSGNSEIIKLISNLMSSNHQKSSKSAYFLVKIYQKAPQLIKPYCDEFVEQLPIIKFSNTRARLLQILSNEPMKETWEDVFGEHCFTWLNTPSEDVSLKVYSMEILYNLSQKYPELVNELRETLSNRIIEETAGFKNRGLKIIKRLERRGVGQLSVGSDQ